MRHVEAPAPGARIPILHVDMKYWDKRCKAILTSGHKPCGKFCKPRRIIHTHPDTPSFMRRDEMTALQYEHLLMEPRKLRRQWFSQLGKGHRSVLLEPQEQRSSSR